MKRTSAPYPSSARTNQGAVVLAAVLWLATPLTGQAAVYQESGGRVVIEAEHYDSRTVNPAGNRHWHLVPDEDANPDPNDFPPFWFVDARGNQYMQVLPDITGNDFIHNTDSQVDIDPKLDFRVRINTPGTYRLFLRWTAPDTQGNSLYAQVLELKDGPGGAIADWYRYEFPAAEMTGSFANTWRADGAAETSGSGPTGDPLWTIATPGFYTIRLTYREDGCAVDTLCLQLDSLPPPTEPGPPESALSTQFPPAIVNRVPAPGAVDVLPTTDLTVSLADGAPALIDATSIALKLDGAELAPLDVQKSGNTTTAKWTSTGPLASGSSHTVELGYKDTTGTAYTGSWSFTVMAYHTFSASAAYPIASADSRYPGFNGRLHQARDNALLTATIARANAQLAGTLVDPITGAPYLNLAVNTANQDAVNFYGWFGFPINPDGTFVETKFVNYSADATGNPADLGNFNAANGYFDNPFPGLPGAVDANFDNYSNAGDFAIELLAFLELSAGWHVLGVHNDDAVELAAHPNDARDLFRKALIRVDTNVGAANRTAAVFVETAGLYAVRLVLAQWDGSAMLEFYSASSATPTERTLVNDRTQPKAIKAWRALTAPTRPYAKSVSPAAGTTGVAVTEPIKVVLADLGATTPTLKVNGNTVTYTSATTGNETTLTYQPATPFTGGQVVNVEVAYAGATGSWSYVTKAGKKALMITGGGVLNAADAWIQTRLAAVFGLDVVVKADSAVTTNDAAGVVLVFNSSTVASGQVANDDFELLPIPIMNVEGGNTDDFKLIDVPYSGGWGNGPTVSQVNVVKADHPLAAGLSLGQHTFSTANIQAHYGRPPVNGILIAQPPGFTDRGVIFGLETGAQTEDGVDGLGNPTYFTHPARRVHFGHTGNDGAASYTDVGVQLFDAAVYWLLGIEPTRELKFNPPVLQANGVVLSWIGQGTLEQAPTVAGPWTAAASQANPQTVPATGNRFFRLAR
ncbi:MAG: hypothetical protein FJ387_03590 [Verrucomicrobia bacterium]|nr:hypothetical protein [Verrucomicrobiota bacterium]